MTTAAPATALRIIKLRRSTPDGTACESNPLVSPNGSVTSASTDCSLSLGSASSSVSSLVISFSPFVQTCLGQSHPARFHATAFSLIIATGSGSNWRAITFRRRPAKPCLLGSNGSDSGILLLETGAKYCQY